MTVTPPRRRQRNAVPGLEAVRGAAARARPNVRRLAAFAKVHNCPTATLAFAAGVDTNRVFAGTPYEMPFGQSPFAIGRGIAFEKLLRDHGHAELRRVLTEGLGVDFSLAAVDNLRQGFQPNRTGLLMRATATAGRIQEIVVGASAPIILDGAVLRAEVGGMTAFFEADEMAIGVEGSILVGENKSWPVIDGRPSDPDALGSALDQAATYVLLGRWTAEQGGADPDVVSGDVVIITPRNTGLSPVLHRQNVDSRVRRVERLLAAVPFAADIAAHVPPGASFGDAADATADDQARLDAFADLADRVGTTYEPGACLSACGFARACRQCAFGAGSPSIAGSQISNVLPGVATLGRVAELSRGAPASVAEAPAAGPIARAGRLYDEVFLPAPTRRPA